MSLHPARNSSFHSLARDEGGYSAAEKALAAVLALGLILLVTKILLGGANDAATTAQRTLEQQSAGVNWSDGQEGASAHLPRVSQQPTGGDRTGGGDKAGGGLLDDIAHVTLGMGSLLPSIGTSSSIASGKVLEIGGDLISAEIPWARTVASGVQTVVDYGAGAVGQFASNFFGGAGDHNLDQIHNSAFQRGRSLGDALSVAEGAFEMFNGVDMIGGAGALAVASVVVDAGTGGVAIVLTPAEAVAVVGTAAAGAALITHGILAMSSGMNGLSHGHGEPMDESSPHSEPTREQRLEELAKDPSEGGKITPGSQEEAQVGLGLEERGDLKGPITRDPTGRAEFIDKNGTPWDVKSFNSNYPPRKGGFELETSLDKIEGEFNKGENVILNTTNLSSGDAQVLREAIKARGWETKILWYP